VLVARYTLPAHRAAFLLGAGEEADDVVQEAFVKAFRHLKGHCDTNAVCVPDRAR
jgi:DNA-directed RNA polymerase specialized sigma24 family protein